MERKPMDVEDKPGQQLKPMVEVEDELLNDHLSHHLCHIDLVSEEILKYLDGSALINLSLVNKGIRQVVISSHQYKKCVNLKLTINNMDFLSTLEPLPDWTAHLVHLTLVFGSQFKFKDPQEQLSTVFLTLPHLSTLVVINYSESESRADVTNFLNKILNLSSNLKSLSIPYDLMMNPIAFDHVQNLEELKFTTSNHIMVCFDPQNFLPNLKFFSSTCTKLKSLTCQELFKIGGNYDKSFMNVNVYHTFEIFNGILTIIENNSELLEKFEFGISQCIDNGYFSSKLTKMRMPNLKFLKLRAIMPQNTQNFFSNLNDQERCECLVLEFLNNLPRPEQLSTLKITLYRFPAQLFKLISQKFTQIKSFYLKTSNFSFAGPEAFEKIDEDFSSFLHDSYFERGISAEIFTDFLHDNKFRKLSLKGMDGLGGQTFFDGILKMVKLNELTLTGSSIFLDDFLSICANLKALEKLEISHLHADKFKTNPSTHTAAASEVEIDYCEILTSFGSLKYLKELSVELWSGDFRQVLGLGSINSFPYLKRLRLTLPNANLDKEVLESIIGSNRMLHELSIVNLIEVGQEEENMIEIATERKNLQINLGFKQIDRNPNLDKFEEIEIQISDL